MRYLNNCELGNFVDHYLSLQWISHFASEGDVVCNLLELRCKRLHLVATRPGQSFHQSTITVQNERDSKENKWQFGQQGRPPED